MLNLWEALKQNKAGCGVFLVFAFFLVSFVCLLVGFFGFLFGFSLFFLLVLISLSN